MTAVRVAANLIDAFGATIIEWPDDDLSGHALAYAHNGWPVIPLHSWSCQCVWRDRFGELAGCGTFPEQRGKVPLTKHGVKDATTDLTTVAEWWSQYPDANIGIAVPAGVLVVDVDPRNDGEATWRDLHLEHTEVPTRTAVSGRDDGGRHHYYGHPGGKLAGTLGKGVDLKKPGGYVVAPPSIHTATGNPYRWVDPLAPIVVLPAHLIAAARPEPRKGITVTNRTYVGDSIADWFTATVTWSQILEPYGWHVVSGDGDADGSRWRHPNATHPWSATIKHGCLFVYSTGTDFEATEVGDPHGYTRFRAFAVLDHRGDLSVAARAAVELRGAA